MLFHHISKLKGINGKHSLIRFRSQLLTRSRLITFRATEMFHFALFFLHTPPYTTLLWKRFCKTEFCVYNVAVQLVCQSISLGKVGVKESSYLDLPSRHVKRPNSLPCQDIHQVRLFSLIQYQHHKYMRAWTGVVSTMETIWFDTSRIMQELFSD